MFGALLCLVLAFGSLIIWAKFLFRSSSEMQASPDCFPIRQTRPVFEVGCGGCLVSLSLLFLSLSLVLHFEFFAFFCASGVAVGTVLFLASYVRVRQNVRYERQFHARIELDRDGLRLFDKEGVLSAEAKFSEVVELRRYQGLDDDRQPFDHCVVLLQDGREVTIQGIIASKKKLLHKIERATGLQFAYRKNSERTKK